MSRQPYDTDLNDAEWALFEKKLSLVRKSTCGRKPDIPRREIPDAILYRLRTGCQWRSLPHDFPAWTNVQKTFSRWNANGYWEKIHDLLCRGVRKKTDGRKNPALSVSTPNPSNPIHGAKVRDTTRARKSKG